VERMPPTPVLKPIISAILPLPLNLETSADIAEGYSKN
jgi:hypothetical protein